MSWRSLRLALLAVIGTAFVLVTAMRVQTWRDPVALTHESVVQAPLKARAWIQYGAALAEAGRDEDAAEAYLTAIRLTDALPTSEFVRVRGVAEGDLALVRHRQGRADEARGLIALAVVHWPSSEGLQRLHRWILLPDSLDF